MPLFFACQSLCMAVTYQVLMLVACQSTRPMMSLLLHILAKLLSSAQWVLLQLLQVRLICNYTGWPRNNGTVDTVDFSGLCSNQQLFSSLFWIEHLFPIIITPRSSNLVENFLFYETFLMDCHFRDLPDFQSFEARWQINGKSQKWQSIRNYS